MMLSLLLAGRQDCGTGEQTWSIVQDNW